MKHLITFTLFFAACHPVRNLQIIRPHVSTGFFDPGIATNDSTASSILSHVIYTEISEGIDLALLTKIDTIHEVMFISTRMPGIGIAHYGQAIQRNGICIAHMDCAGHILKPPVYVWSCETERKRRGL